MAKINVVDLSGTAVGELELADEVFGVEVNKALLWEAVNHYRAAMRQGTAAPVWARYVRPSGDTVVPCTDRSPARTTTSFRRRSCWAR